MNKRLLFVISIFILSISLFGCGMPITPQRKVENLFKNYQNKNELIITELDSFIETLTTDDSAHEEYKKVYLRQYQDLKYEIKDETIDGDYAKVTSQIEVYDYYKTDLEAKQYINDNPSSFTNNGVYDANKALLYRIGQLSNTNERVTYTITINLTKVNNEWTIDNLSEEDLEKIHGTYVH